MVLFFCATTEQAQLRRRNKIKERVMNKMIKDPITYMFLREASEVIYKLIFVRVAVVQGAED